MLELEWTSLSFNLLPNRNSYLYIDSFDPVREIEFVVVYVKDAVLLLQMWSLKSIPSFSEYLGLELIAWGI